MFTLDELRGRDFALSPQTMAGLSRAETALVRLEDKAEDCEVRLALRRVLSRLEAVSSIRIEGRATKLEAVLKVESLLSLDETDSAHRLAPVDALDFRDPDEMQTTLEVVYYQMALGRIYRSMGPETPFTPQSLLDLHSVSRFGLNAEESGTRLRSLPYMVGEGSLAPEPPVPEALPRAVTDLCSFINQEAYSPIGQAGVAHFQFECAKPFKTGLDKTGRLMSHAILHRRGLARHIPAAIGLAPAVDTRRHAECLLPYRFGTGLAGEDIDGSVDRWVDFCAYAAELSCKAADTYLDAILSLRSSWFARFGRPNRGSALEELLGAMPGHPVLTVRQAANLLGKSVSSVNDALLKLEAAGIVCSQEGFDRNRVYVAPEAVEMLEALERRIFPQRPVARDSLEG